MKKINILFAFLFIGGMISAQAVCPPPPPPPPPGPSSLSSGGSSFTSGSSNAATGGVFSTANFDANVFFNNMLNASAKSTSESYSSIKGSPYLTDDTINGYVVLNNGSTIKEVPMQFDAYRGEFVVINDESEEIYLDGRFYQEVGYTHEGETKMFRKVNPEKPDLFYEVLFDNQGLAFFKETKVTLREGYNNGMYEREPKFNSRTNYFIKQDDQIAKVKLKKSDVFRQFPEFEHIAMNEYIQKHGIKLKGEKAFASMFAGVFLD